MNAVSPFVLIRDLVIFFIKLALDGMKDVVLMWLCVGAVLADLVLGGPRRGRFFYGVMRMGERFDLWLNLYAPSQNAELDPDGLLGRSRAGSPTYVGKLEELIGGDRPTRAAPPAKR